MIDLLDERNLKNILTPNKVIYSDTSKDEVQIYFKQYSLTAIKNIMQIREVIDNLSFHKNSNCHETMKNRLSLLLDLKIDFSQLNKNKNFLRNCDTSIRVVFHVPFLNISFQKENNIEWRDENINRAGLILLIKEQIGVKSPLILITSKSFYMSLLDSGTIEENKHIIPIFINKTLSAPMLCRQYLYFYLLKEIHEMGVKDKVLIMQDSDLIPIRSNESICKLALKLDGLIFSVRNRPDVMPVNGGLYYVPISEKSITSLSLILVHYFELLGNATIKKIVPGGDIKMWDGDQFSLSKLVDFKDRPGLFFNKYSEQNILLLPMSNLNLSIQSEQALRDLDLLPFNIHLKGLAKHSIRINNLKHAIDYLVKRLT